MEKGKHLGLHMCLHAQTTSVPVQMHARAGGFPPRVLAALNPMKDKGGSSGSRPRLGGNQQHMNHVLGRAKKEMKEQRKGGRKGWFPV